MPIKITQPGAGDSVYSSPWDGPTEHTHQLAVDVAALLTAGGEVDTKGWLKPGVIFKSDGTIVSGAAQLAHGVTIEAIKVAATNVQGDLTAAGVVQVGVGVRGSIRRAVAEKNLGRVYSANEVAALAAAGSHIKLLS